MQFPIVHSVHFYDDAPELISRLCGIVSGNLLVGDSVLIVATPEHRAQLVKELCHGGIDLSHHARDGRYTMVDAGETLRTFCVDGALDQERFESSIGHLVAQSQKASRSKGHSLTVFGEMVAVLWDAGHKEGALQLEAMWNHLLNNRAFHLHCAYPRQSFASEDDLSAICELHTHAA